MGKSGTVFLTQASLDSPKVQRELEDGCGKDIIQRAKVEMKET